MVRGIRDQRGGIRDQKGGIREQRGGIRDQKGGIRDQRGGIRDQKGGIWDHSSGIRDHKPWDQDQQFFKGSGCIIFAGTGTKICHTFGIKDQKVGYENGINDEKAYLVTTLISTCHQSGMCRE